MRNRLTDKEEKLKNYLSKTNKKDKFGATKLKWKSIRGLTWHFYTCPKTFAPTYGFRFYFLNQHDYSEHINYDTVAFELAFGFELHLWIMYNIYDYGEEKT